MAEAAVMTASKHKDTAVFGRILATWGGPNTALFRYIGGEGPILALHFLLRSQREHSA